jgi:DNA-binding response OmpR family regulator
MIEDNQILLVEDDVLIGMMLADMLEALGFPEPVQATNLEEAETAIAEGSISAALVDINLGDKKVWPLADALAAQGIPFAFTTGGGDVIPSAHADRNMVSKPFRLAEIDSALQNLLARNGQA